MNSSPFAAFLPGVFDPVELLPPLLDLHQPGLGAHSLRTAAACVLLAEELGLSAPETEALRLGALYHDAGKLLVPATVLEAPRALTPEEHLLVRRHVAHGLRFLRDAALPLTALDAVAHHHERWDGSGYPLGLVGERIPLPARLLSVVDVYDTLRSRRSYGPVLTRSQALRELARVAGRQLDPDLVPLAAQLSAAYLPEEP